TAVDISEVALARAAAMGPGTIAWRHLDLIAQAPEPGAYDLVSAHYFGFPRAHEQVLDRVLAAVAPGGTLLVVGHAGMEDRFPEFSSPGEIAARLNATWQILVDEIRPRVHAANGHADDVVIRARKL
ncbi:MAG TPA: class I SAM-dependent methyltransferase, partial [Amycolatopsis sp.]|nr:class I SAM-dependent methyltransferase [Amycolatopsis sp.]